MSKITTDDCKAFLADYKDTDFLKLLKRWSWKSPKPDEWVRLSKYKDKQGRVARDFTNKAAPLLVTLVEGPNGLEISRERAIGPWEKLWTGKLVDWQRKRSLPDCDKYIEYCVYGSAKPDDYQFGVVPGVYSGEGLEHVFYFQPLAIRDGEVWDHHIPIDRVIKNVGGTLEEGAGELQEATWEFVTPTDHMKAKLIQWGFTHNPQMDVQGVPVIDHSDEDDDDIDGARKFGGSMPSDFNFGIVEDNGTDVTVFIRPKAVPDWDQDIPLDRIIRNGGGVLPPGSGESMECSWYIPQDKATVMALLTGIGMVYDCTLDEDYEDEDEDDEDEDEDEDESESPHAAFEKSLKGRAPNEFRFGIIPRSMAWVVPPRAGWGFYFHIHAPNGFTWDGHVPIAQIANNVGKGAEFAALGPSQVQENIFLFTADVETVRRTLTDIGFIYDPKFNDPFQTREPLYEAVPTQAAPPDSGKWVAEAYLPQHGQPEVHFEDGGQAAIMEIGDDGVITGDDGCFFVKLQSWDEKGVVPRNQPRPAPGSHKKFMSLLGKKVRITIEVIDE